MLLSLHMEFFGAFYYGDATHDLCRHLKTSFCPFFKLLGNGNNNNNNIYN